MVVGEFTRAVLVRGESASAATVRGALERFGEAAGLVPAGDGEPVDREWAVTDGGGGWTLVTDTSSNFEPVAVALSGALGATTVTCALYDSDATALSLYAKGKRVAEVVTGENVKVARRRVWAEALGEGVSLERFHGEVERLRDEGDAIDALAPLLGCTVRALRGLCPDVGPTTQLRFRLRERPRWEALAEGPGRLEELTSTRSPLGALLAGQRLRVTFEGNNRGGAFQGLRIEIGGDAVSRKLLAPTVARVRLNVARAGGWRIELPPRDAERESVVLIADVAVSAGRVELPTVDDGLALAPGNQGTL